MEFGWALRRPMRLPDSPRHERGLPAALRGVGVKPEVWCAWLEGVMRTVLSRPLSGGSDEEQQYVSVQVEHVDDQETEIVSNDVNDTVQHSPPVLQPQDQPIAHRRTKRSCGAPIRLIEECDMVYYAFSCVEQVENTLEPATYTEAVVSGDRENWISAMQEEMQSLEKNGTWKLVHLPKQKKPVHCKWIFKRKEGLSPSEPPRFKARLVAKGFSQIAGVDYNDVFSPVVKHSSIRTFFSIVAMDDLELKQLDVKTTFLHGELEDEIYMDQPEGFIVPGKEDYVCKLKRSLYGLKQSPRQWYKRFDSFMLSHGFKWSEFDSCVYIKFVNGSPIYLLLYVDDMLIAAKSKEQITTLKKQLSSEFDMKDLGAAKKILGMEITRDINFGLLFLSQQSYIKKVLEHFNMHDAKPISTPIAAHFKLSALQCASTDEDVGYMSRVPYSSAVGSLMYAMICSRPDLSHAMSLVSRYMANPGKEHWKAVQWFFRYLRGTTDACSKFGRTDKGLVGYVDSDFAANLDKRRSFTVKVLYALLKIRCFMRTKYIDIKYHYVRDVVAQGKPKGEGLFHTTRRNLSQGGVC
uniref:OSJNBb0013J13.11 protein n=1 Tax=Oryza sativa subsp. japonica TaxID=39947 RepID=Q7XP09_ORYSJ|nr:OSJNBb0013J13.11 [Oryza sativa Japonica Group]